MADLKPGWKRVKFGEVVRLVKETCKDPVAAGIDRVIGLEHLEPGDLRIRSWADVADGTTFTHRVRPGQVLFGKRRAYQRKVAIADFDAICSGDIYVFESANPEKLLPELLPFLCQTDSFFDHAVGTSAGSLSPRTNWSSLAEYEFALPPLEEQRRFADLLRCTTQSMCAISEAAAAADDVLRSTAKAIFEHELARCRRIDIGKVVAIIDPNPSHRYPDYVAEGIPLVATQDFEGKDGYAFAKAKRVPASIWEEQNRRCHFAASDVVFARKGVLGLARRYGNDKKAFSHTVVMMKPRDERVSAGFLLWLVRSNLFMSAIKRAMNSNSGVPTLGVKTIESVSVPLPDLNLQYQIMQTLQHMDEATTSLSAQKHATEVLHHAGLEQLHGAGVAS